MGIVGRTQQRNASVAENELEQDERCTNDGESFYSPLHRQAQLTMLAFKTGPHKPRVIARGLPTTICRIKKYTHGAGTEPAMGGDRAMTTSRDWSTPETRREAARALEREIQAMSEEPGSGVRMCHEQGKTAVYLSDDEQFLIEHEPNGTIHRVPLDPLRYFAR